MEKKIDTCDGLIILKDTYDIHLGDLIDVYNEQGEFLGIIEGSLNDYNDDQLYDLIKEDIIL